MQNKDLYLLDKAVSNRINSSQVIIELKSAVKELVENSIDAGATSIEIKLVDHGTTSIEVRDNGSGIEEANFENLARRSSTSKISNFEDIHTKLSTFGFRGEALNSLCSISDVSVITRISSEKTAFYIQFDHFGNLLNKEYKAREVGTTFICQNLFKDMPVRQKEFFHTIRQQLANTTSLLQAYAIMYGQIRFLFTDDSKSDQKRISTILCTSGTDETLEGSAKRVLGKKVIESLQRFYLEGEKNKNWIISGLISSPQRGRKSKDIQFFFVNKRPIDPPKKLERAINETYKQFSSRLLPAFIINIKLNATQFDINLTPDKRSIFLELEENIAESIKIYLKNFLSPTLESLKLESLSNYFSKSSDIQSQSKQSTNNYGDIISQNTVSDNIIRRENENKYKDNETINNEEKSNQFSKKRPSPYNTEEQLLKKFNIEDNLPSSNSQYISGFSQLKQNMQIPIKNNFSQYSTDISQHTLYNSPQSTQVSPHTIDYLIKDSISPFDIDQQQHKSTHTLSLHALSQTSTKCLSHSSGCTSSHTSTHLLSHTPTNSLSQPSLNTPKNTLSQIIKNKSLEKPITQESKNVSSVTITSYNDLFSSSSLCDNFSEEESEKINKIDDNLYKINDFNCLGNINDGRIYESNKEGLSDQNDIFDEKFCNEAQIPRTYYLRKNDEKNNFFLDNNKHSETSVNGQASNFSAFDPVQPKRNSISTQFENLVLKKHEDDDKQRDLNANLRIISLESESERPPSSINLNNDIYFSTDSKEFNVSILSSSNKYATYSSSAAAENSRSYSHYSLNENDSNISELSSDIPALEGGTKMLDFTQFPSHSLNSISSVEFNKSSFKKMQICGQFNLGFIITALFIPQEDINSCLEDNEECLKQKRICSKKKLKISLFIIDQHAADEKARFEHLNKTSNITIQPLIKPLQLELSPVQHQVVQTYQKLFKLNGFTVQQSQNKHSSSFSDKRQYFKKQNNNELHFRSEKTYSINNNFENTKNIKIETEDVRAIKSSIDNELVQNSNLLEKENSKKKDNELNSNNNYFNSESSNNNDFVNMSIPYTTSLVTIPFNQGVLLGEEDFFALVHYLTEYPFDEIELQKIYKNHTKQKYSSEKDFYSSKMEIDHLPISSDANHIKSNQFEQNPELSFENVNPESFCCNNIINKSNSFDKMNVSNTLQQCHSNYDKIKQNEVENDENLNISFSDQDKENDNDKILLNEINHDNSSPLKTQFSTHIPTLLSNEPTNSEISSVDNLLPTQCLWTHSGGIPRPPRIWSILASRACRYAIMIGKSLNIQQMQKVVYKLAELEHPWNCPHGRPTMRHLFDFPNESEDWLPPLSNIPIKLHILDSENSILKIST